MRKRDHVTTIEHDVRALLCQAPSDLEPKSTHTGRDERSFAAQRK
jgi:hypothetical protein